MPKFIKIPILLNNDDPEDTTDYESLNISRPVNTEWVTCLLNVETIERVNDSGYKDYKSVIWTFDGLPYHCGITVEQLEELL